LPGENLTRVEAATRAGIVSTHSYEIALDLTTGDETFLSTTTVRFTATPGGSTFIDAITRTVRSITLNGESLDPAAVSDGVRIQLANLQAENELTIVADAIYTNTGEGLHRFVDPVDGEVYLYSQFEVPDSRRMFAVFEQPDLRRRSSSPSPRRHTGRSSATRRRRSPGMPLRTLRQAQGTAGPQPRPGRSLRPP